MLAQMVAPLAEMFPPEASDAVLVGLGAVDDGAVYALGDGRVLVVTLDLFPPVVDGAADFGAIAAANAMSDVWAMGADPVLALNVALFPADMPPEIARSILTAAGEQVRAAGAVVAGGHTMDAKEPSFGMAVVGFGQEASLLRKGALRPGDRLVLTKPLGSGVLTTAAKRGALSPEGLAPAVAVMRRLNQAAGRAARRYGVRAATDITGFGLLGHGLEMAEQSGVNLHLRLGAIPLLPGAAEHAEAGHVAGGCLRNRSFYAPKVDFADTVPEPRQLLLYDPQTSGGLLLGVAPDTVDALLADLRATDPEAAVVGEVVPGTGRVVVTEA